MSATTQAPKSSRKLKLIVWLVVAVGILGVLGLGALIAIRLFVAEIFVIQGPSMAPAFPTGTRALITKTHDPNVGDVIVFESPHDGSDVLKRVIARGPAKVSSRDGALRINDKPVARRELGRSRDETQLCVAERVGDRSYVTAMEPSYRMAPFEVQVPSGSYFVMGDTRDRSADSRYFGTVAAEKVIGIATLESGLGAETPCRKFEVPARW